MEKTLYLVDNCRGIYSFNHLVNNYDLFVGDEKTPIAQFLQDNDIPFENCFHPDNDDYLENIDFVESYGLFVSVGKEFWAIYSENEGVWAIHPDCEWNEKIEFWE